MKGNALKTILCDREMKSPVMLGSGTLGESKESLIAALEAGAGGVVNRTLRLDNTNRKPFVPAYYISQTYMLNSDNNNATPWSNWIGWIGEIESHGRLAVSISARNPDDGKSIALTMERSPPSFYELNFSCSHSAKLYGAIGYETVAKALSGLREVTKIPLFLKLSLDNMDIPKLSELEGSDMVDAYVLSNTIGPGLKVDIKSRRSALGSVFGGLSGAALKPLVLAKAHDLISGTKKPVIGVGGIEGPSDALEYIILGCQAVQVYTAAHRNGMKVFGEINAGIKGFLAESGESLDEIRGSFKA